MAPSKPLLLGVLLLGGTAATLLGKWQDMICVAHCDAPPSEREYYEQPVWQTLQMFIGEMLCFIPLACAAARRRTHQPLPTDDGEHAHGDAHGDAPVPLRGRGVLKLWLPAACDLTGSTLNYLGLLYMPVSIYQMTRGVLVLFVGLFSAVFLHKRLLLYQWAALASVTAGVALVGLCGYFIDAARAPAAPVAPRAEGPAQITRTLFGVCFVVAANLFTATQFIIEESLLTRYSTPALAVVAYEGVFGALTLALVFIPLLLLARALSPSLPPSLDLALGLHQIAAHGSVQASAGAMMLALGCANFLSIAVTRYAGATARSLVDTCRTLLVWAVSLAAGWEHVVWPASVLQVLGFALLVYGTMLYNDFVRAPACLRPPAGALEPKIAAGHSSGDESAAPLLAGDLELDELERDKLDTRGSVELRAEGTLRGRPPLREGPL